MKMKLKRFLALWAALALVLAGCGAPPGDAPASSPPPSSSGEPAQEEAAPREPLGSGGVYYEDGVEPLEGEQEVLLRDYMTAYYEALARLEPGTRGSFSRRAPRPRPWGTAPSGPSFRGSGGCSAPTSP